MCLSQSVFCVFERSCVCTYFPISLSVRLMLFLICFLCLFCWRVSLTVCSIIIVVSVFWSLLLCVCLSVFVCLAVYRVVQLIMYSDRWFMSVSVSDSLCLSVCLLCGCSVSVFCVTGCFVSPSVLLCLCLSLSPFSSVSALISSVFGLCMYVCFSVSVTCFLCCCVWVVWPICLLFNLYLCRLFAPMVVFLISLLLFSSVHVLLCNDLITVHIQHRQTWSSLCNSSSSLSTVSLYHYSFFTPVTFIYVRLYNDIRIVDLTWPKLIFNLQFLLLLIY